jgi:hypothetical protein
LRAAPAALVATVALAGCRFDLDRLENECDFGTCGSTPARVMGPVSGNGIYLLVDGPTAADCGPTSTAITITPT